MFKDKKTKQTHTHTLVFEMKKWHDQNERHWHYRITCIYNTCYIL